MSLPEDFDRWRDDPMTRRVFAALRKSIAAQKAAWEEASWGGSVVRGADLERLLSELRTRADAYASLEELTAERLGELLEIDPDAE